MQMRYAVEVVGYVGYYVALHYLLMINIIYHLDQRMIDFSNYLEALNRRPQIVAGMVEVRIERLNHYGNAAVLKYGLGRAESLYD